MKISKKVLPLVFLFSYSPSFAEGIYKKHLESGHYDQAEAHADGKFKSHEHKAKRYQNTRETIEQDYGQQPDLESETKRQVNKHVVKTKKWLDKGIEAREAK
ncbi:MAG: hypothetical protein ABIQ95_07415, partial [Bdellovibrionia bacterium]